MVNQKRRWICRIVFLLLAVFPTLFMSAWAGWAHARRVDREKRDAWEHRIVQELGLIGQAREFTEGQRGDLTLEDVTLVDPETEQLVTSLRRVHVAPAGERGWVIDAAYPQIPGEQLLRLWNPIYDRLRRSRGNNDWSGLLTANNVTLKYDRQQSETLSHVECQFGSSRSGAFAKMNFVVAGLNMSRRAELIVSRDRELESPETVMLFNTGPQPLPCSLAYAAVPTLEHLGRDCRFQGKLKLRLSEQGWRGDELSGQLTHVDLSTLITEVFAHHLLTGDATIDIRQARFEDGRLTIAEGVVYSENGLVSRSLLDGAAEHLGWHIADQVREKTETRFRYAQMHFDFQLHESGLTVHGKCGEPGVIMLGEDGPLAWESGESIPVTNVVRLLVPDSTHQVPATRQTAWLSNLLPVPSIAPQRTAIRPENPPLRWQNQR
jgi:hypothetical protein